MGQGRTLFRPVPSCKEFDEEVFFIMGQGRTLFRPVPSWKEFDAGGFYFIPEWLEEQILWSV